MFHVTERLLLRPAWPEDWQQVYAGVADERVVMNLSRVPWPYRPEDAISFTTREQDPCFPNFLVTLAATGEVVGSAGLVERDAGAEIGYWIAPTQWGHGYASEAANAVVRIARALGFARLSARHFTDNPASGRVLRRAGFRPTGVTSQLPSVARGGSAPAVEYALELNEDLDLPRKRAA